MNGKSDFRRSVGSVSPQLRLILLAMFFLCGIVLGRLMSGSISPAVGGELEHYLTEYYGLETAPDSLGAVLLLYMRYPVLAFLLGFASVGWLLLPALTVLYGCCLSFSVSCFTAAFGASGWLVAAASLGLRCLITLPCYFGLAASSWQSSAVLAGLALGRQGTGRPQNHHRWLQGTVSMAVLLLGVYMEWKLGPRLLRWALGSLLA